MNCNCCFTDFLAKCEDNIIINTTLPGAYTSYKFVITDKFDNKYEGPITFSVGGGLEIQVTDLPAGLLTQYSGSFKLEIYDEDTCKPVNFKMTGEYDCIGFDINGGNFEKNNLGCEV